MNSNAPTYKVAKRSYAGTRGACIHPKGCKVRSIATNPTRQGIRKYNKRGVRKRKMKTNPGDNHFKVFVNKGGAAYASSAEFMWDTGAQPACVCGLESARDWGLLIPGGQLHQTTGQYPSVTDAITGVSGVPIPSRKFHNFPIEIQWHGQTYGPIIITMTVYRGGSAILGAPPIGKFRKLGLSVSFK